jgi:hypothetical protein
MPLTKTGDKGMTEELDQKTYKPVHLTCRARFFTADGIQVQFGDHDGFTIKTVKGGQRAFLLLRPGPTAVDVTNEVKNGLVWKFDR